MDNEERRARGERRRRLAVAAGLVSGGLCGIGAAGLTATAGAPDVPTDDRPPLVEATHLPPLLTVPGEPVELRYDVYCLPVPETGPDEPCAATGSVFARAGASGPFRELRLVERPSVAEGRLSVRLPDDLARSRTGFSYYAILRNPATGAETTVPPGGAGAPQRSLPLEGAVEVRLGAHRFGAAAAPSARVARAAWGSGPASVGLEPGRNLAPIGATSFDVGADGTVHLLDEANRRVLRWRPGASRPEVVPVEIDGTLADLSVAGDGTMHVLESTGPAGAGPFLRSFAADGTALGATRVAQAASQVRIGAGGTAVVNEPAGGLWSSVARAGRPLGAATRSASGRPGRSLAEGGEVVVLRVGDEIRLSLVDARGARKSWRITSETPIAEVQLAEPLGRRLVVVARLYSDAADEFLVLVLGAAGVEARFAVDTLEWAESAPLSRFRLVGSSLYRLGSTPAHAFVDRFDLPGAR
jgi:hypothetical protein